LQHFTKYVWLLVASSDRVSREVLLLCVLLVCAQLSPTYCTIHILSAHNVYYEALFSFCKHALSSAALEPYCRFKPLCVLTHYFRS